MRTCTSPSGRTEAAARARVTLLDERADRITRAGPVLARAGDTFNSTGRRSGHAPPQASSHTWSGVGGFALLGKEPAHRKEYHQLN
jgi:hypothetical protein